MITDTEKQLENTLFNSDQSFLSRALHVLEYQAVHNPVYNAFLKALGIKSRDIAVPEEIPLLPVRAFKYKRIVANKKKYSLVFKSSGTSFMAKSEHAVPNPDIYKKALSTGFYSQFKKKKYSLLAYMPGYSDNPQSSLIWMAQHLINSDESGISSFIESRDDLKQEIFDEISKNGKKLLLFGAAFGLLDLIENDMLKLPAGSEIIETGGMKTHKREISKSELRDRLSKDFGVTPENIHSEYGMCELLSQMYAIGGEWFTSPHWVNVSIRNPKNPMKICKPGEEGKIGIIDLANLYSCPFILTDDKGVMDHKGRFRVLGRWNKENMRGCNFLFDRD